MEEEINEAQRQGKSRIDTMSDDIRGFGEMENPLVRSSPCVIIFFSTSPENRRLRNFVYRRLTFIPWSLWRFCSPRELEEKGKANREKRYCSTRSRRKNVGFYKRK